MSSPNSSPQLDIAEVAAEMERDPLSKALFENAQLRVLARSLQAQNDELLARIDELTKQHGDGKK
jgi:hypothetical protein